MKKVSGVYKITNTVSGDFYIGSSKDVKQRWAQHKCLSTWKNHPNNPLYKDMQKYGTDKFEFEILEEVEIDSLKKTEQQFIELLKPTYNDRNANGLDIEKRKEYQKSDKYKEYNKEYKKSNKYKEYMKEYMKEYQKSDKCKKYMKEYQKSDKCKKYMKEYQKSDKYKESHRKANKKYNNKYHNQLCCYNDETLTLQALYLRFYRAGIEHPAVEAKKYILKNI